MIFRKRIVILRPEDFVPKGFDKEGWFEHLSEAKPDVFICYDRGNAYDKDCMMGMLQGQQVGYVSADHKHFLKALLDESPAGILARMERVVCENEHTPVIELSVIVDTKKIQPIEPDEAWEKWHYSGPLLRSWGGSVVPSAIIEQMLQLSLKRPVPMEQIKDCVEPLQQSLMLDMSVDTSNALDDLISFLESNREEWSDEVVHLVERAMTKRRSQSTFSWFTKQYWPDFLDSEESRDLWNGFVQHKLKHLENPKEAINRQLSSVVAELEALPFGIGDYADNLERMRKLMFYRLISGRKQLEIMSALTLRHWLQKYAEADKLVIQQVVHNYFKMEGGSAFIKEQNINYK